jgi:hypothetical protein
MFLGSNAEESTLASHLEFLIAQLCVFGRGKLMQITILSLSFIDLASQFFNINKQTNWTVHGPALAFQSADH